MMVGYNAVRTVEISSEPVELYKILKFEGTHREWRGS